MRQKENDLERSIHVNKAEYAAELFGSFDVNAKRLEKAFGVTFSCRDSQIHVIGEEPVFRVRCVRQKAFCGLSKRAKF